ncbi:hypothetical protein NC653_018143 [Populus alba x Populus x berolinensis]|uniref:Uncharacterized protein n=1 Tax=Populus alba x Populus x berolinensis TaxID=444605 RepID=A0AAD6QSU9_9ROSI|nr:hypothetical protein NC653_018143 [Populus alba x Populus x berolinensis]
MFSRFLLKMSFFGAISVCALLAFTICIQRVTSFLFSFFFFFFVVYVCTTIASNIKR